MELDIFSGAPELPESMYEKNLNTRAPTRTTGKSGLLYCSNDEFSGDTILGDIYYNKKTKEIEILYQGEAESDKSKTYKTSNRK